MICEWGLRHWVALKVSPIKASKTYFRYLLFLCPAGCFMGWNLTFLIHISVLVNSTRGFQLCSHSTCFWYRRPRDKCCAEPGPCLCASKPCNKAAQCYSVDLQDFNVLQRQVCFLFHSLPVSLKNCHGIRTWELTWKSQTVLWNCSSVKGESLGYTKISN